MGFSCFSLRLNHTPIFSREAENLVFKLCDLGRGKKKKKDKDKEIKKPQAGRVEFGEAQRQSWDYSIPVMKHSSHSHSFIDRC